jgi:Mlc titration factor MtfA (ptsG expression regulator)
MNVALPIIVILAGFLLARILTVLGKRAQERKVTQFYEKEKQVFDNQLSQYNPYYKSLDLPGRDRFLRRVSEFMESKDFQYIDVIQEEIMPLLISSAAIQLTFGLDNYLLDHFTTIYLLKDNYRYGLYNTPFEGHVSEEGIYLSWSNFLREFSDYSDGQNVGLHEMAHALVYVNFTSEDSIDHAFHDRFKDFSSVGRPIFEGMSGGDANSPGAAATGLLGTYASTNYQEFWAVCVETFFERPVAFKKQIPTLYLALCTLLNQDPLTPAKILKQNISS